MKYLLFFLFLSPLCHADTIPGIRPDSLFYYGQTYVIPVRVDSAGCNSWAPCRVRADSPEWSEDMFFFPFSVDSVSVKPGTVVLCSLTFSWKHATIKQDTVTLTVRGPDSDVRASLRVLVGPKIPGAIVVRRINPRAFHLKKQYWVNGRRLGAGL